MSPTTGAGNYAGDKATAVVDEVGETATTAVNTKVLECAPFIKSERTDIVGVDSLFGAELSQTFRHIEN
jgi:hypothetical protein